MVFVKFRHFRKVILSLADLSQAVILAIAFSQTLKTLVYPHYPKFNHICHH